jgi:hypothetical protein
MMDGLDPFDGEEGGRLLTDLAKLALREAPNGGAGMEVYGREAARRYTQHGVPEKMGLHVCYGIWVAAVVQAKGEYRNEVED